MGNYIDKKNSHYWTPANSGVENDDFQAVTHETKYNFNWGNLQTVIFTQALPWFGGMNLTTYAFKFALLAEMNQGCIPSLFTLTSIYIAVLFYFKFNEILTYAQIGGIILMIPCVAFLSIDPKDTEISSNDLTEQ